MGEKRDNKGFLTMRSTIYFLRHGLPEHDDCLRGVADFKLTELGFKQMEKSAKNIDKSIDVLISSPLKRCLRFAEDYGIKNNLEPITDSAWAEVNFGLWDGKPIDWINENFPDKMQQYWDDPWSYTPPEGESFYQFSQRLDAAYDALISKYFGKNILVVTHSGVMRYMLSHFLDIAPQSKAVFSGISLPYAALFKVEITKDKNQFCSYFYF